MGRGGCVGWVGTVGMGGGGGVGWVGTVGMGGCGCVGMGRYRRDG